ncbi:hypothetical protein [Solemya velum gill symbiont]|uniref:hypothetical protein n=1 Tax=Solemya velum gill symbiont TaxID=2340 RepID=UPI000998414A|nr:hypothetical protein [Solemya velum gill symbiont]OOY98402.1 hypothetical protein BOW19_08830 [Solemya velum gill symbiont]OOZ00713.1 hypothetical protein BOW20_08490 [Solemya velum gill symbiont]OOZ02887.1 hypothetical protein BOW21_08890 [Solemya velum gill symbiont]OOZ05136.1 hypothetical protein BOW22_08820 [Solemya velum gill symbiont]OOZ07375.1 hypothetical protein BOW23_08825 [Solemya velum gill symbiont]
MKTTESQSRGPFWALLALTGLPFMLALYFFYNPDMLTGLTTAKGPTADPCAPGTADDVTDPGWQRI